MRLLDHADKNWPQLAKVRARYHGSFAHITGVLRDGQQIPLFRLRYGGSAHSFGFAFYSPARDRYEDAVLLTGLPIGSRKKHPTLSAPSTSQDSDTNPNPDPPTNLQSHPLKAATTARFDDRFPLHPSHSGGPVQVGWQVSPLLSRTHMHLGSTARRNGTRSGSRVGS